MERFDIARYISAEESVCREERQFALYLRNILHGIGAGKFEDEKEKILDACGLPADASIEQVFYEVTFMRDILNDSGNIPSFNLTLMDYIRERSPFEMSAEQVLNLSVVFNARERNDGKPQPPKKLLDIRLSRVTDDQIKSLKDGDDNVKDNVKSALWIARAMMKSKPDLAIVYKQKETGFFMKFIECKYTSPESSKKIMQGRDITQTEVQEMIIDFLCEREQVQFKKASLKKSCPSVDLVRFISNSNEKMRDKEGEGNIEIADLVSLNSKIFS